MTSSGLALHPPESLCDDWALFSGLVSAPTEMWQEWLLPLLQPFSKVHSLISYHPPGTTSASWSLPKLDKLLFLHTSHSLKLFKVSRHGPKKLLRQKGTFSWSQGSRPVGTISEAAKLSYHRNKDFQSVSWGLDHTQFRAEDLRIFHFSRSTLLKKKVFRTCIEGWQGSSGATKKLCCQAC